MSAKKIPPVPADFSLEHEGRSLNFSKYTSRETRQVTTIIVERLDFPVCPICLEPDPDVAEHVPPESLGGQIMTMTCRRCNHDFGTAEDQLRKFIDLEATVHAQTSDGSVKGRRAATVSLRSSEGRPPGAFVRSAAPEFDDVLRSGSGELAVTPLDMPLVLAAGLKHAYLAACLHQQAVPESADVDRVRAVLVAARDRDREALMDALEKLGFEATFGWIEAVGIPPVLLLETEDNDPHWVILFGGRFILQWPFADVQPRAAGG
jgi:hypothetical protein